jgi:hypothetical protein
MGDGKQPFSPDGRRFIWIPTDALDAVREKTSEPLTATAVLLALYRIGNRERSATFTKPMGYVATLANVGRTTAYRRLVELKAAGLVEIEAAMIDGTNSHAPSRYTLPSLKVVSPINKIVSPTTNLVSRNGQNRETLPKEYKKDGRNDTSKPLTPSEKITAEKQLRNLEEKLSDLAPKLRYQDQKSEQRLADYNRIELEISTLKERLGV